MHWYIIKDIICLIQGRNLFDSKQYLFDPKIFCLNQKNVVSLKQNISLHQRKRFIQIIFLIQSNILSECSTFDGNPPQPLITISKLKELHQSNSKSAIQEIHEKLKAIIDCKDTDFSDFVDAVAHYYTKKKDLIESKIIICLNDFLWFKEMICLNEKKFVWFKQNIFEPNKYRWRNGSVTLYINIIKDAGLRSMRVKYKEENSL